MCTHESLSGRISDTAMSLNALAAVPEPGPEQPGETAAMRLERIGVRILAENFGACFDFYTKTLGLEVLQGSREGPRTSFGVPGGGSGLSMLRAEHMGAYQGYRPYPGTGHPDRAVFVIATDDVNREYDRLREKGVIFASNPQTIPQWNICSACFRDPDGNLFELCQEMNP